MKYTWQSGKIEELINYFHEEQGLWDPTHAEYMDNDYKNAALERIRVKLHSTLCMTE